MRRLFGWVRCFRSEGGCRLLIGALLVLLPVAPAQGMRMGATALGGVGIFVPADDAVYNDVSVDLYPEIGLQIDVSALRLGLKVGWIYNRISYYEEYYDDFGYWYDTGEYTRSYIPLQAEVLVAPLDLVMEDPILSPYAGVMAGTFLSIGDVDDTSPAFSVKVGSEIRWDPIVLYGDIRYTWAMTDSGSWSGNPYIYYSRDDVNVGGWMIVVGMGLRLDLSQ